MSNINCSGPGTRGQKRPKDDTVNLDLQGVRFNYQRGTVYACYKDADGRARTMNKKPAAPQPHQDVQECIHDAARELYQRLRATGISITSLSSGEETHNDGSVSGGEAGDRESASEVQGDAGGSTSEVSGA